MPNEHRDQQHLQDVAPREGVDEGRGDDVEEKGDRAAGLTGRRAVAGHRLDVRGAGGHVQAGARAGRR